MNQVIFSYLYLIGMLGTYLVRISGVITASKETQKEDIMSPRDKVRNEGILITVTMLLWFVASQVLPILYILTNWFDFADIHRPNWIGFLGFAILVFADWLLWKSHHDLGYNWSSTVQIKSGQSLVTQGIYQYLRHPIYTAHILWGIAAGNAAAELVNGLAGISAYYFGFCYSNSQRRRKNGQSVWRRILNVYEKNRRLNSEI